MSVTTVLVLPSPPALLAPRSVEDPVADLRRACGVAVSTLPEEHRVVVLAAPVSEASAARGITAPLGHRVAASLLGHLTFEPLLALPAVVADLRQARASTTLVVMADGSARRGEKAPGHLHPDAVSFDERIEAALRAGDTETLRSLDPEVGEELWCEGVPGLRILGEVARDRGIVPYVSYADAPFGVAWWVARWDLSLA